MKVTSILHYFGLFHSKRDPLNTCLVSGINKLHMRPNQVSMAYVSIVAFVSWAKITTESDV